MLHSIVWWICVPNFKSISSMTLSCISVTKHWHWYLQMSDTPIHADSITLFALNIDILLAKLIKPEKTKILTLTWPVTSSVTSKSNVLRCSESSRPGLSNGVWNLEIVPVVWEISGGLYPPPSRRIASQTPPGRGRGLKDIGFLSPFLHKNRTDFNNTSCYHAYHPNHLLLQRQCQCGSHPTLAICMPTIS